MGLSICSRCLKLLLLSWACGEALQATRTRIVDRMASIHIAQIVPGLAATDGRIFGEVGFPPRCLQSQAIYNQRNGFFVDWVILGAIQNEFRIRFWKMHKP